MPCVFERVRVLYLLVPVNVCECECINACMTVLLSLILSKSDELDHASTVMLQGQLMVCLIPDTLAGTCCAQAATRAQVQSQRPSAGAARSL